MPRGVISVEEDASAASMNLQWHKTFTLSRERGEGEDG